MLFPGKFVSVQGTVVRVSNIKPMCTKMAFQCNTCGDVQVRLEIKKKKQEIVSVQAKPNNTMYNESSHSLTHLNMFLKS